MRKRIEGTEVAEATIASEEVPPNTARAQRKVETMIIVEAEGEDSVSVEGPLFLLQMVPKEMIIILSSTAGIGSMAETSTLPKQAHGAKSPAICVCVRAVGASSPRLPKSTPGGP